MDDPDLKLVIGILAVVVLGAFGWYFRDAFLPEPEPEPAVEQPVAAEPEVEPGPKHPLPAPADAPQGELVELPALDDSDAYFLLEVANNFHPAFEALLVREAVIDRLVATVDNLTRGKIADNIRPVTPLPDVFDFDYGDGETQILGPSSYARYDAIVAQIYYLDLDSVYDTYRRFYPLFQQAYERLGYPDAYFNDRLVEVVDHLLATPVPAGPIVLVRPNVLYQFADPDLEALSSGQKLMLRMGPANAATMKRVLGKFRARLTEAPPAS
mgnify:FL=1